MPKCTSPFKVSHRPVSATPQCTEVSAAGSDSLRQTASEKDICNNLILNVYFSHLERDGFDKLFQKHFSRMCRGRFLGSLRSVAVCDFNFIGMTFLPCETDSVRPVNPDAALIFPVKFQLLRTVSRRFPEFRHIPDAVDLIQFPACNGPDRLRAAFPGTTGGCSVKNIFCAGCFKGLYHVSYDNGEPCRSQQKGYESASLPGGVHCESELQDKHTDKLGKRPY